MKINCTMPARLLLFCSLAWLWFTLINHLRVEWAVNPQYAYGWAVPFLCLYLLWTKVESRREKAEMLKSEGQRTEDGELRSVVSGQWSAVSSPVVSSPVVSGPGFSFSAFQLFSFCLLAFLYLPTRLIQEANPEWRLVSWALALEVIGLTLLLLKVANAETLKSEMLESEGRSTEHGGRKTEDGKQRTDDGQPITDHASRITHHVSRFPFPLSAFSFSDFVFPILFFLVAVPWPTFLEGPLVQGLMRANVGATVALLGLIGIPAIPHGNVIEVASGMVGIDDACSGIRSFQATLMIALFLGELYALSARRRVQCVVAGFALAFLFNVGRTLLLTWVASAKGVGAVASWHDPAGVTILVACFLSLWLIARGLKGKAETLKAEMLKSLGQKAESDGGKAEMLKAETLKSLGQEAESDGGKAETLKSSAQRTEARGQKTEDGGLKTELSRTGFSFSAFQYFSIFLTAWLFIVEAGTELWYRSHEWGVPKTTAWSVEFPRDNPTFQDLPFSDKTKQFLRFDEGWNGTWQEGSEQKWQAIFFRWNPGRIAVHLAKSHTPEVCLTAAGRDLVSQSGLRPVRVHGLQLPFRSYVCQRRKRSPPCLLLPLGRSSCRAILPHHNDELRESPGAGPGRSPQFRPALPRGRRLGHRRPERSRCRPRRGTREADQGGEVKFLLLNQTFYPDVMATGQYLTEVALSLVEGGHRVTVVTSRRAYDQPEKQFPKTETWRGICIYRVGSTGFGKGAKWRRAADFASFLALCSLRLALLPRH